MRDGITIRLPEYGRLLRRDVPDRAWRNLRAFDEQRARTVGTTVFDWQRHTEARAKSLVGVIQVPGLCVEILPKVDGDSGVSANAQRNLLFMLGVARDIRLRDVGLAAVDVLRSSLLEAFAVIFAERLLSELLRGPDRGYVRAEKDLGCVKGRLVLEEQLRRDAAHLHKLRVRYDEFSSDTEVNRVLVAAAKLLAARVVGRACVATLHRALDLLAGVTSERRSTRRHMGSVSFTPNNRRYESLYQFACMVLYGDSPTPRAGDDRSFSILFPMERLFEEFFARYVRDCAELFGLDRAYVHPQARGHRRWLLAHEPGGAGAFRLQPDLVVEPHGNHPGAVLDTKWKLLKADHEGDGRNGVSEADVYQMAAYALRYGYPDCVLVYPHRPGVTGRTFKLLGTNQRIRIATIRIDGDLRRDRAAFDADVAGALRTECQIAPGEKQAG